MLSATIPLLFDPALADDVRRAKACYKDLVESGLRMGWPPYRLGVDYMDLIAADEGSDQAELYRRLKTALDPNNIISPGRYSAVPA